VAEGVETREQLDFLKARGCHSVQGFLLARPMPGEDFARFSAELQKVGKLAAS
jgi:EAL domain-containing protein (putative c-di-GMP-specific phosphodiesterase class I)